VNHRYAAPVPHVRSGALSALAVAGKTRSDLIPNVPTIDETVPGYEAGGFVGIAVRKETPPEIIERLNREINAGLDDAAVQARLAELATRPRASTSRVRELRSSRNGEMGQSGQAVGREAGITLRECVVLRSIRGQSCRNRNWPSSPRVHLRSYSPRASP
jgi:hypothetical protein